MDKKEPEECEEMFESFAQAEQQQHSSRNSTPTARTPTSATRGVHQVTTETSMDAALAAMAKEIKDLKLSAMKCEAVTTRSGKGGESEQTPADDDDEPVDEEIEMEALGGVHERRVPATLQHIPKYAKFLKDLLSNKKKLEDLSTVTLNERCSAVVQNKLPEKLADPGVFTIPCLFGGSTLHHALADLGASINLMPYSLFEKLGLGDPAPTRMSISLADRSVKYPRGIVENLLVKVDKFMFPADFVILDMEVDDKVPLILGRPFLRTAKALIDVFDGKITFRVGDENVTFDVMKSMKHSSGQDDSVFFLDTFISHKERCLDYVCGANLLNTQHLSEEDQQVETDATPEQSPSHPASRPPEYPEVFEVAENTEEEKKPSVEAPPSLELKELPSHLEYAFLDESREDDEEVHRDEADA
ncbi:hypothetical protein L1987_00840 [Smallanthus sonchifolius]|uniref:Uncharacterized protein n=1 Tax=Smallanthus sonchifolius TaxID=185202 RepID=A0ACB9K3E1_9ASTR|nr:hypothetical protein L1987_00840 [Smallanthus sonchifolius]